MSELLLYLQSHEGLREECEVVEGVGVQREGAMGDGELEGTTARYKEGNSLGARPISAPS